MQQLSSANRKPSPADGSAELVDLGLAVSRLVRAQMRRHAPRGLTLPQLRALAFVNADPACARRRSPSTSCSAGPRSPACSTGSCGAAW